MDSLDGSALNAILQHFSPSTEKEVMALEELQFLTVTGILRESTTTLKRHKSAFTDIASYLVFRLSIVILTHPFVTYALLIRHPLSACDEWIAFLITQFLYLLTRFTFSVLSTTAMASSFASIYASSKPLTITLRSTLSGALSVFGCLSVTFLWVSLFTVIYGAAFTAAEFVVVVAIHPNNQLLLVSSMATVFLLFLPLHVGFTALWRLASAISVLEPVCRLASMKMSYSLLQGRTSWMAGALALGYLVICGLFHAILHVIF